MKAVKTKNDRFGEDCNSKHDEGNSNNFIVEFYHKHKKLIKIILTIISIIIAVFYFIAFFQKGIVFHDEFLRRSYNGNQTIYSVERFYGNIAITVEPTGKSLHKITYNIGDNQPQSFIVFYDETPENNIEIYSVDNNLLFKGKLGPDSKDYGYLNYLLDENGEVFVEDIINFGFSSTGNNRYNDYKPSYANIVHIVVADNVTIKGNVTLLIVALFILGITAFDIKYPLAFFTLSHFLEVRDPEPTDFYLIMQKLSWVVLPIIAAIILIISITVV